jgi:hypothetical protein
MAAGKSINLPPACVEECPAWTPPSQLPYEGNGVSDRLSVNLPAGPSSQGVRLGMKDSRLPGLP